MKKIFTTLAIAAMALPAAAEISYTVIPEEGVVSDLSTVVVEFQNCDEIDINTKDDITVSCNGAPYNGMYNAYASGPSLYIDFRPAVFTAGTYEVTLGAYSISTYVYNDDGADFEDLETDVTFTYVIEGGASEASFDFTTEPADGMVSELSTVTVTFPDFEEIEINSKDDLMVIYKGEALTNVKAAVKPYGSNNLVFTFDPVQTEAGTYEVYIPTYSISGYDEDYNYYDLEDDLSIFYTISAAPAEGLDFIYTLDPEEGEVESLENVQFTFGSLSMVDVAYGAVQVTLDGEPLAADAFATDLRDALPNVLNVTFVTPLETPGKVEIVIPADKLTGKDFNEIEETNKEAIKVAYTIVAPAEPVAYDIEFTKGMPQFKNGDSEGIIDINDVQLEVITFNAPIDNLGVKADGATIKFESADGSYSSETSLKFSMQSAGGIFGVFTQFKALFPELPKANGTYYITVPQGSFGDQAWLADPETGHSNPELKLEYTFVGFPEVSNTVYDVEPTAVNPENEATVEELVSVTLTFAEGIEMTEDCDIVLESVENRYSQIPTVTPGEGNTYVLTFSEIPSLEGTYSLIIAAGSFGDAEYVADNKEGHANDDLFFSWTLSNGNGVEGIAAEDADEDVYTVSGLKVNADKLPAGLYIKGGKKFIVR